MQVRNLRWWIAGLLFASTVINYIDRQTLSVVAPVVTKELGISPTEYSYILQAFLLAYTVMYVLSGPLVDRWGTKASLATFVGAWSLANALHMFARNALQLGAFRFLLGIAEPGNYNAAARVASEWYPPRERALINGLVNAGSALGAIIAAPLVAWLTISKGWRFAFLVTGGFGLLWLMAWWLLYQLPDKHPWITAQELALIRSHPRSEPAIFATGFRRLWRQRAVWGLLLARFFSDAVWWFYLFWLPNYLVDQRGFSLRQVGLVGWIPYLTADGGAIAGGYLSGRLIVAGLEPLRARYIAMAGAAFVMPLSITVVTTRSPALAVVIISLVTLCHMVWKTNLMTITNDLFPAGLVGSVAGIVSLGSGLGGLVFMNLTGRLVEYVSYHSVFVIMGFLHPAAFVVCRWLVGKEFGTRTPVTIATAPAGEHSGPPRGGRG